jgi:hypothetical protein
MKRVHLLLFILVLVCSRSSAGTKFGLGSAVADHDAKTIHTDYVAANTLNLPACTGTEYTVSPVDLATTFYLDPLGHMSGVGGHLFPTDHIYFYIPKATATTPTTNIYSPGNVTIYQVAASEYLNASPRFTDYSIRFAPCQGLQGYFFHVNELSAALQSKIGAIDQYCSTYTDGSIYYCTKNVNVTVDAGEVMGSITGRVGSTFYVVDFGAYDHNQAALPFISPARLFSDEPYTRCPIEPFTEPVNSQLRARFGRYDGSILRTEAPTCGEINYDVAGTAQGLWYVPGTPQSTVQDISPHLALVRDNVLPSTGAFSVGNSMSSLPGTQYYFDTTTSGHVNLEFDRVTPDGTVYCYDTFQNLPNSIILVQLTDATTLKIERQTAASCGAGPWTFTASATTFER